MARKRALVEKRNILNDLISREFTLQELRLFSIYLGRINARDLSTRVVRLGIKQFYSIMGVYPQKISYLKEITNSLLTKVVNVPNENNNGYSAFQLFKECRIDEDDNGQWYFEIEAHIKALPLMFNYKRDYFKYELWNVLNLESVNQFRMYEVLKQHEWHGEHIVTVAGLKALLGIGEKEYPEFSDFKKDVLKVCQRALKEKTDITFTYEPHVRSGRGGRIQSLRFVISKNQDYKCQLNLEEFLGADIIAKIKQETEPESTLDVSQLSFIAELSDKDKASIMDTANSDIQNIRTAYNMAKQQGNINNLTGWIIYMVGELQAGKTKPLVEEKQKRPMNRFVNFEQRDIGFADFMLLIIKIFEIVGDCLWI